MQILFFALEFLEQRVLNKEKKDDKIPPLKIYHLD
jgi:hypothetical protein